MLIISWYFMIISAMYTFMIEVIFKWLIILVEWLCDFDGLYEFGLILFAVYTFVFNYKLLLIL